MAPATGFWHHPTWSAPGLDPDLAWVALGSNLGDPRTQLERAVLALANTPGLTLEAVSTFRWTAPVGPPQPHYLNGVCRLRSALGPASLLATLHQIERAAGRVRAVRWGPRTIDLDLLFFATRALSTHGLVLPHPSWHLRAFVIEPLCELEGNAFVQAMARWQFGKDLALPL